jgi:PadR family transcriptional regulator PadR
MQELTIQEEIVLTAIWRLREDAYGVRIRKNVAEITHKQMMYGTLYNTLSQLLRKGYVSKIKGEPTSIRGGRSKMYYQVTKDGLRALQQTRNLHRSIWKGIPEFVIE